MQSNVWQTYWKVCFWCRILYLSFCTTVLNSSGWNSFLTSCPLCLLVELLLCVQYIFYIMVLLLLDSQIWQWLSTNTSCPQGKFPLIPPCFWLAMLCHFMVSYHPCPQRSRETGTFFQSLKLIQTVSHCCWKFSNTFVAELVVIASVNHSIGHSLEGLLTYSFSQGEKHWVISSVSWVSMLN